MTSVPPWMHPDDRPADEGYGVTSVPTNTVSPEYSNADQIAQISRLLLNVFYLVVAIVVICTLIIHGTNSLHAFFVALVIFSCGHLLGEIGYFRYRLSAIKKAKAKS